MTRRSQITIGIGVLVVVLLGGAGVYLSQDAPAEKRVETVEETPIVPEVPTTTHAVIGASVEGRDIEVYTFGVGDTHLLFVGGIHGGYEWNSVLLAYTFIDYFREYPEAVPETLTIGIIPSANPDAVYTVTGKEGRFTKADALAYSGADSVARFNAHGVDLNRNFACKWQPNSSWRGHVVSAGTSAFSEPESRTIRDYVADFEPSAVVFWHSQANAVYASECHNGVLPETIDVMNTYGTAANYRTVKSFDAYPITGDAEGWLASIGIPAVTVELSSHTSLDWEKNKAGVQALLEYYASTSTAS